MPDIPQWVLTGGVSAIGPIVIYWLLKIHIPSLLKSHSDSLTAVLADSKANRETFEQTCETHRVESQAEQQRLRHAASEREQAMLARLDLKDKQIERLILRSAGPIEEQKGQAPHAG